jgi:cytochrome b561
MTAVDETFRYDERTIALHWAVAAIVVFTWCLGQSIDWFPRGMARTAARSVHIVLGLSLIVLIAVRLRWRATAGRRLPAGTGGRLQRAASAGHVLLYALLLAGMLLGLANVWVRGDSIFGLFRVPEFDPGNKELREQVEDLHALAVNVLFGLAGAHAALALFHHYVLRDGVLRRMLRQR